MEYLIEIKEVLSRQVKVEAESVEKAVLQVTRQYLDSEIVLSAGDFTNYEINAVCDTTFRQR